MKSITFFFSHFRLAPQFPPAAITCFFFSLLSPLRFFFLFQRPFHYLFFFLPWLFPYFIYMVPLTCLPTEQPPISHHMRLISFYYYSSVPISVLLFLQMYRDFFFLSLSIFLPFHFLNANRHPSPPTVPHCICVPCCLLICRLRESSLKETSLL
jgi:hypothetical protein